ncbi:AAA family ATPase [Jeotgalibacillus salarius]|uniref:ATP-binding cassette domain-containing protein n=1 Tax=Jeotgalibacillus salarius TaxID=546023 RepID=A0A4Y8LHS9_9BACL|nr:AAA family ATPase [Jeotgalibacillus salarius]TFE02362.1 ATP-binding cassette domain-containing protein [Jeotgalibacillus salarius]
MFLKRVALKREEINDQRRYPFHIPAIRTFSELDLKKNVTFFVGENGSGKSTLLEAIADQCGFNTAGGGRNNTYELHASDSALGPYLRLSWMPKVTNGFFLRAESFYQFATHLDEMAQEDMQTYGSYGGKSLHDQSHGESFLSLFANRFQQKAIYLLDEPEAALSPQRQLALLKIMHDLEQQGSCQFIIATHSPILLGYPGADILSFDQGEIQLIEYEMTDHYQITHYFLQHRERMLEQLFSEEDEE